MSTNHPPEHPEQAPRDREIIVTNGGGAGAGVAIGIAIAVVVLVVLGFLFFGGNDGADTPSVDIPDEVDLNVDVDGADDGGDEG